MSGICVVITYSMSNLKGSEVTGSTEGYATTVTTDDFGGSELTGDMATDFFVDDEVILFCRNDLNSNTAHYAI